MAPNAASGGLRELSGSFWSISLLSCRACGYALLPIAGIHDFQVPPGPEVMRSGGGIQGGFGALVPLITDCRTAKLHTTIQQYSNTAIQQYCNTAIQQH